MQMEIPVDERTLARLEKVAAAKGIPVEELVATLVIERLNKEENNED